MQQLADFIRDPENPRLNYSLAECYFSMNQYISAVSFYLRAAERGDTDIAYDSLLQIAQCYSNLKNRDATVEDMLQQAISLKTDDYRAYYKLSKLYEKQKNWASCYFISKLGYSLTSNVYLKFQLSLSSWWTHKADESRALFRDLAFNDWYSLDETHKASVENNLQRLGSGPESQAFTPYFKSQHKDLRLKFNNSDTIQRNYSQVYQDIFVLTALDGKRNGTFLEIGGSHPFKGNNTALLEQSFGWTGFSIEIDENQAKIYKQNRPTTTVLCRDATTVDYKSLLSDYMYIDYLQLDIEPSRNTFEALLSIPFDDIDFGVITYEHDYYIDRTRSYKNKSRRYLESIGYRLIAGDISPDGKSSFEDWYINPQYISRELYESVGKTISAKHYIFDK